MLINCDLNPQLIYRINRILYDILGNEAFLILPGIFDRYSRKFNWVGVHKNRWDDFKEDKLKNEIIKYIEENYDDWRNFLKNLDKKFIEETNTSFPNLSKKSGDEFYFHFLNLYSSYPIHSDKFIDGIVYKHFEKHFKYAMGNLCKTEEADGLKLVNIELFCENNEQTPIILKRINQLTLKQNSTNNTKKTFEKWANANLFFLDLFNVIFYGKNPGEYKKKGHFELIFDHFMVFPIYDYYDKETSYGNFYGDLVVFYKEENSISTNLKNEIVPHLHLLSSELEKAAIHKILEQEIKKDTILEHFIEHLPILQDWECVMVQNTKIEYCYKRNSGKWSQCKPNDNCQTCPDSQLQNKGDSCQKLEIPLNEIFNHGLIPELDKSDIKHCKSLKLICEYPSYTKFPDDEEKKKKLENFYKRQQLDLLRQLALQQKVIKETIKHGTRTAIAAIMSREDSHNIGSHVLASLNQDVIRNRPLDVEKLMNYIQQRWDFIAGIIPGYPGWSEPLFFFADILNGFFEQGLLLDYLIKDDGVGGNIIRFCIKYKTRSITFVKKLFVKLVKKGQREEEGEAVELNVEDIKDLNNYDKENIKKITKIKESGNGIEIKEIEVKFVSEQSKDGKLEDAEIEDFLVDIPGGVVGCHAFYCILENIMRNAAKYSCKKETGKFFEIFINIMDDLEDSNLFSIKISDNCSKENDHFKIADIQGKLKEDLVDRKGEIVSKDWGIQVIKLGTKYLRSPCDEDTITVNAMPEEKDGKYLAYKFEIRKPRLVTVADFNACVPEKEQTKGIKIKRVKNNSDLENLVKDFFPQLLIILPEKNEKEIINFLAENNLKFPARILLCGNNEDHAKQIKEVLCTLEKDGTIPKRRCFVGIWRNPSFDQGKWEEKFIIRACKEWVWSFAEIENSINIVAYFDRVEGHPCFERWTKLCDKTLKEFELENSIKLSIYGKRENENDKAIKVAGEECDKNPKNIILFDNHGKLGFEKVTVDDGKGLKLEQKRKNVCIHYHSIGSDSRSGFNNRCIFDTLANVSPGFSGVFALLLLIESAITKVLVIDERVAKSLVMEIQQSNKEKYIQPNKRLDSLQASGCFVPFFLRWPDKSKCLIKEYGEEIQKIAGGDKSKEEGLWFNGNLIIKIIKDEGGKTIIKPIPQVDFVVIHRGIFETFLKEANVDINTFTNLCKNISPRVIITSGRPNTDNKNKETNNLPFLEYSGLQRFIIQEFSKYQICRILFSVR